MHLHIQHKTGGVVALSFLSRPWFPVNPGSSAVPPCRRGGLSLPIRVSHCSKGCASSLLYSQSLAWPQGAKSPFSLLSTSNILEFLYTSPSAIWDHNFTYSHLLKQCSVSSRSQHTTHNQYRLVTLLLYFVPPNCFDCTHTHKTILYFLYVTFHNRTTVPWFLKCSSYVDN